MDLRTIKNFELWLRDPYFDDATREELREIKGNVKEIEDRFYKDLEFGTGGLRGIIGAGTNRMNIYTVRRATQGLANYIKEQGKEAMDKGVAIAYDSRRMSKEFSQEAARVLAGNGIKVYVFENLAPTPQLSFTVRYLKTIAGIVITASHNPAEYNGYKVYWEDGAQIATDLAKDIMKKIDEIQDYYGVIVADRREIETTGMVRPVPKEAEEAYLEAVKEQCLRPEIIKAMGRELKIVYTPLHGAGNLPVRRVLKDVGFEEVFVVPEQEMPNGDFPTVDYPNPEERSVFNLAIELAEQKEANLILGTDPDCDRVGVMVKNREGQFVVLTGNQVGALLIDYILTALKEEKRLPKNGAIIKTIVTSEMGTIIAEDHGIETFNTLTGFKFIGEKIREFEKSEKNTYIFGYEESYGYLAGTYARDKDGVVASMLICEMAAYYHQKGMNLYDGLLDLYERYGYFKEDLRSITLKGKEGVEKIQHYMETFRKNPPQTIGERSVVKMIDYMEQDLLPKADVLKFLIDGGGWIALRPSGTEPKLKIYGGVKEKNLHDSEMLLKKMMEDIISRIQ